MPKTAEDQVQEIKAFLDHLLLTGATRGEILDALVDVYDRRPKLSFWARIYTRLADWYLSRYDRASVKDLPSNRGATNGKESAY